MSFEFNQINTKCQKSFYILHLPYFFFARFEGYVTSIPANEQLDVSNVM